MPTVVKAEDLLHDKTRLSIVALLAGSQGGTLAFTEVQQQLDLTAGNLSSHIKMLQQHEMITVMKQFERNRPLTTLTLSAIGNAALHQFIEEMERVIHCLKNYSQE